MNSRVGAGRLLLLLVVLFLPDISWNEARAEQFRFQWGASLSLSEQYDDNIRLAGEGEESDWITYVTPGIRLSLLMEETEAHLDYNFSLVGYAESDDLSTVRHSLGLSGFKGIPVTERTTLDLDEHFTISEDPLEIGAYDTSVRTSRDRYYRNTFLGRLNYLIGPEEAVYAGFGHIWLSNEAPDVEDSQEFRPLAGFNYWFSLRYGIRAEYSYAKATFDRSSDYDQHLAMASLLFRINPRTEANLSYNYDSLDYEVEAPSRPSNTISTITAGLSHEFSETMAGSISGGYFATDLTDLDNPGDFSGSLSFRWSGERSSFNLDGSTGYRRQFFEAENLGLSFFGRAAVVLTYQFLERLSASLTGSYQVDDYKETTTPREDSNWWAIAQLNHLFLSWLNASLRYEYRQRQSTGDDEDFVDNRVTLSITALYAGMPRPL